MLVYLRGTLMWRPENSKRLELTDLIISTEKTRIYISTFPYALTSNRAQNSHEKSIYFSTNSIVALCVV